MGCSAMTLRPPLLSGWIIAAAAFWSNYKTSSDFIGDAVLRNERLTIEIPAQEIIKELTLNLSMMQRYASSSLCSTFVTGESPTAKHFDGVTLSCECSHKVHSQLIMVLSRNGPANGPYALSFSWEMSWLPVVQPEPNLIAEQNKDTTGKHNTYHFGNSITNLLKYCKWKDVSRDVFFSPEVI